MITIEELATFCKKKGFVFPSSEIYGGYAGFWDLGPLGVELLNNIKADWWKYFVQARGDIVGIDASVISHPRTWEASGHLESFGDLVLICSKCKTRLRADHFIEEKLNINSEGMKANEVNKLIKKHNLKCDKCDNKFEDLKDVNLLFKTNVGATQDANSVAYLRGETAQAMFMDFKLIAETSRQKLPFGIAQIGRCFRNEISPREFMFRSREFHIGEFEYFIHPNEKKCNLLNKKHLGLRFKFLDAGTQLKDKSNLKETSIRGLIKSRKLDEWHAYWLAEQIMWLLKLGLKKEDLKIREHTKTELSHYSSATFDIDYSYPFGSKELVGNANRGQYDLNQHMKESKQNLKIFDENSNQHVIPKVIEPTFGMERLFLAVLCNAYKNDKKRGNIVLLFDKKLAPIKTAVFPLVSNKKNLVSKAKQVYDQIKNEFNSIIDVSGSIGRRYARADEQGILYCITIDHESLKKKDVTIRNIENTKQIRVKIKDLRGILSKLLNDELKFEKAGKLIRG